MELMAQTYYTCRNGQRVYVDCIILGNPFITEASRRAVLGYIGPAVFCWQIDGRVGIEEHDFDIVAIFEDYVDEHGWGLEDIDTGEKTCRLYASHRSAFDDCVPGWKVVEMVRRHKIIPVGDSQLQSRVHHL
jgi:hypothetical protein